MSRIGRVSPVLPLNLWVGPVASAQSISLTTCSLNRAYFMPFQVLRSVTVTKALLFTGTASGNFDIGIYDNSGVRLGSTGSTASTVTSGVQTTNLTASVTLVPGVQYWAAFVADNTSITVERIGANVYTTTYGRYNSTFFPLTTPATFPGTASGSFVRVFFE
jgi:hypothetical protein